MTTVVELYKHGTAFATRPLATSIVEGVEGSDEIAVDFTGVVTAAPSFVDQLVGDLSEKAGRVWITGLTPRDGLNRWVSGAVRVDGMAERRCGRPDAAVREAIPPPIPLRARPRERLRTHRSRDHAS